MSTFQVHAGDFPKGKGSAIFTALTFPWNPAESFWGGGETVLMSQLESAELASEDAVKRLGGTVGWGVAGAVLLGPLGLLAGLLVGGRGKDVTFIGVHKDGRKFLATTDSKTFTKISAALF
jgi:hypothetical protein